MHHAQARGYTDLCLNSLSGCSSILGTVTKFNTGELKLTIQNSMQYVFGRNISLYSVIYTEFISENDCIG